MAHALLCQIRMTRSVGSDYWAIFYDPDIPLGERIGWAAGFPLLGPLSLAGCVRPMAPDAVRSLSDVPSQADASPRSDAPTDDAAPRADHYCPPAECQGYVLAAPAGQPSRCVRFAAVGAANGVVTTSAPNAISVIDINHDLRPDLYLLTSTGTHHLFVNQDDGRFVDVAANYGLALAVGSRAAAWADYDQDGDTDLALTGTAGTMVYRRDGDTFIALEMLDASNGTTVQWIGSHLLVATSDGTRWFHYAGNQQFSESTIEAGVWDPAEGAVIATADYDGDGALDIYLANVTGPNRLWRNLGDNTFVSVESTAGVAGTPGVASMDAAWIVWFGDQRPSLYVAHWDAANHFFRNNHDGTFTDQAEMLGIRDPGNTVVARWRSGLSESAPALFLGRWEQTPLLYLPQAQGTEPIAFANAALAVGLADLTTVTAAEWSDFDADGRADLALLTPHGAQIFHNDSVTMEACP